MEQTEILRSIVAKIGKTDPGQIGPDFSLETPLLKGSISRAALAAAIRQELGVNCPTAHTVTTFGNLEKAVFGTPFAITPSSAAARSELAVAKAAAPQTVPQTAGSLSHIGPADLRCGVDVEMIDALPEAADYREHEFYKESFSPEEIAYCLIQENPRMHFAARWCAKEALHKCDAAFRSESMANVEVARTEQGDVFLRHRVNGTSRKLPHALSLSHTNSVAVAFVVKSTNGHAALPPLQWAAAPQLSAEASGSRPGNSFTMIFCLAWLAAMGLALMALIRTY
jgi:phosphopantetheine--protein transferase-like protein